MFYGFRPPVLLNLRLNVFVLHMFRFHQVKIEYKNETVTKLKELKHFIVQLGI